MEVRRLLALAAAIGAIGCSPDQAKWSLDSTFTRRTLTRSDRSALAEMRVQGRSKLTMLVASKAGKNALVAETLERMGGSVRFRDDTLDYLRVVVPVDSVERIEALPEIQLANVEMEWLRAVSLEPQDPRAKPTIRQVPDSERAGPHTPRINPFTETAEMHAPQFIEKHPTFDGRGVTIGFVDTGIDPEGPSLQKALNIDGSPVQKIAAIFTPTDPRNSTEILPHNDGSIGVREEIWVMLNDTVHASAGAFIFGGNIYKAPGDGPYRIGIYDERKSGDRGWRLPDAKGNRRRPHSDSTFAVLWDERTNTVWVDTNQSHRFDDKKGLTTYNIRHDVSAFGKDDPKTPIAEHLPFVVHIDSANRAVAIDEASRRGGHGMMVASTAAANGYFGGAFDGIAPNARVVMGSVPRNQYIHSVLEGTILAIRKYGSDLVSLSWGECATFDDGQMVFDIVVARITERLGKAIFVAAGNAGPGVNSLGTLAAMGPAITVGAYMSKGAWRGNFGLDVEYPDYIAIYSGRGPSEFGGFDPDVLAPTGALSAISASAEPDHIEAGYDLPAGYQIGGGTSQATPSAAGAAALLISAAKQSNIPYDAARLRRAFATSGHRIADMSASDQGNGLIQVDSAWEVLRRLKADPITILTEAPVHTVYSRDLVTPNVGGGLYEREGWHAGDRQKRTIRLTRVNGPSGRVTYPIKLIGNDGTYTVSDESISLSRGKTTEITVDVAPATPGLHSAILNLIDPADSTVAHQVMLAVVAAEPLTAENGFTLSKAGVVRHPGYKSYFVEVPPGARALTLDPTYRSGRLQMAVYPPTGEWANLKINPDRGGYDTVASRHTIEHPGPGVYEIIVENSGDIWKAWPVRAKPAPPDSFELKIMVYGAELTATSTDSTQWRVHANNSLAALNGAVGARLVSVQRSKDTLTPARRQIIRDVTVPKGTDIFKVELVGLKDSSDVDIHVFFCSKPDHCQLAALGKNTNSDEAVTIRQPDAGKWRIVVDAFRVAGASTVVEYADFFPDDRLGSVVVQDAKATRAVGAGWDAMARASMRSNPDSGRTVELMAELTGDGIVRKVKAAAGDTSKAKVAKPRDVPIAIGWGLGKRSGR